MIREAKRVFFLGFGYAKENLNILGIPDIIRKTSDIYGTALGLTDREIKDVVWAFRTTLDSHIHCENLDCLALLRKYL